MLFIIIHHFKNLSTLMLLFLLFNDTKAYIFIYAGCSQEKYQPSSPYEANLNSFLTSVVSSSSQSLYNNFAQGNSTSTPSDTTIYGLYQCRGDLKPSDCTKCAQSAVSQIGLVCPYSFGATLQLEGCYVRYERYDFVGKPDTTLMYKRCSKGSTSDDPEFFRKRDDVLAALQGTVGFRVSSSGSVQGFGQCLGDLSPSDCSNCLAEAVKGLKTLCGSSAAAHVFLAKCYAQYWADGYYDLATGTGSDPSHEDEVAKTIAIIVGIIGGVAVLIVLLSMCRKSAAGGGGK